MSIEQTLSSMAYRQLTQNMPALAPNLLGFEIITHNDDNTFALGVNVAVIGDTYIFIPTILKNGKIAPVDIMYVPELDQFLPCKDAWLSYIQSKKTDLLASLSKKKHTSGSAGNVNLEMPFNNITKVASGDFTHIMKVAGEVMVDALCNAPTTTGIPCLDELVDIAQGNGLRKLASYMESTDGYNNLVEFYTNDDLKRIAEKLKMKITNSVTPDLGSDGDVKILTSTSSDAKTLPTEDKVRLLRDGAIIKDTRGLTPSTVYKTKTNAEWCVPEQTGVYELLKIDGTTLTAYVIESSKVSQRTEKDLYKGKTFYVMPLDDGQAHRFYTVRNKDIIGQPYAGVQTIAIKGSSMASLASIPDTNAILLNDAGVVKLIDVYSQPCTAIRKDDEIIISRKCRDCAQGYDKELSGIIVGKNGAKMRIANGFLRTGADTTYFGLCPYYNEDTPRSIKLLATSGGIIDALSKRAGNISLNIFKSDSGIYIESDIAKVAGASDVFAEYTLVQDLALTPEDAHTLVKEANASLNKESNYIIKIAADTHVALSASDKPTEDFTNTSITLAPMQNMSEEDRGVLNKAMESGTKEIFDVSILRILAEEDSPAQIINEWMPALFTALDRVGRILYLCRSGESMQDAYGTDRVDDVERKLRKQFNELGDIILTMLKGKIKDFDDLRNGEL